MKIGFSSVSVGLSSEPSYLVIEAFLAGIGEAMMFPEPKKAFDSFTYGFGHLLKAMDGRDLGFLTPQDKGRSCSLAAVGHLVDVAQILFHHRCSAQVFKLKAQLL